MGTLRGDDGGGRPSEGGGVPDLPPEWGTIVIPDDAAELDREATRVRRELRRTARRSRWRRRLGLHSGSDGGSPSLGLPLLIMSIAVVATLTSLFALAWPSRNTTSTDRSRSTQTHPSTLPDVTLHDASGAPVRLRDTLPAVILLVDGCVCDKLVADTVASTPAQITVLAVARTAPVLPSPAALSSPLAAATNAPADPTATGAPSAADPTQAGPAVPATSPSPAARSRRLRALSDPQSLLIGPYASGSSPGRAVVVLVRAGGEVVSSVTVSQFADFEADVAKLI
jgi:hypothetical protein